MRFRPSVSGLAGRTSGAPRERGVYAELRSGIHRPGCDAIGRPPGRRDRHTLPSGRRAALALDATDASTLRTSGRAARRPRRPHAAQVLRPRRSRIHALVRHGNGHGADRSNAEGRNPRNRLRSNDELILRPTPPHGRLRARRGGMDHRDHPGVPRTTSTGRNRREARDNVFDALREMLARPGRDSRGRHARGPQRHARAGPKPRPRPSALTRHSSSTAVASSRSPADALLLRGRRSRRGDGELRRRHVPLQTRGRRGSASTGRSTASSPPDGTARAHDRASRTSPTKSAADGGDIARRLGVQYEQVRLARREFGHLL